MLIIDAHSHLWLRQDTQWNGFVIKTKDGNGSRSEFLGEERQMLPPFMIDGRNTAEVFLSNMDYAQVGAAVVVQEFIDGLQNDYLRTVQDRYPDRFFCYAMVDYLRDGFYEQARHLMTDAGFHEQARQPQAADGSPGLLQTASSFRGMAIPGHRLFCAVRDGVSVSPPWKRHLTDPEMMKMFRWMEANDKYLSITLADGDEQVAELHEVIEECPRLKIAIGHLGMADQPQTPPWENESWRQQILLAHHENVMLETGGITWLYNTEFYPFPSAVRAIREAADLVGWDKLMWGSDYPRTITAITYRMSYDFITRSTELTADQKATFLGENAQRFYGFKNLPEQPYIKNMSE